jgi:sec-independent protein translocase protein TatC
MSTAERASSEQGMTLVEHLSELRHRLIICVVAVGLGMLAGFILYPQIFDILIQPYKDIAGSHPTIGDGRLLQTDPLEGFSIRMRTSVYAGVAFAMPVLLWQIWRFVSPGLYANESDMRCRSSCPPCCCSFSAPRSRTSRCPGPSTS